MRLEQCPLPGGGSLTVYLRDAAQAMPNALRARWWSWCPAGAITMSAPGRRTRWPCSSLRRDTIRPSLLIV